MILYEGPSLLDPDVDIVVIAVPDSNPKTGPMLFTWILRQDRPPEVAAYDGSDSAICGDCKFRAQVNKHTVKPKHSLLWRDKVKESRLCYVRLSPAEGADEAVPPSEVWRKWKAGEFIERPLPSPYVEDWSTVIWDYSGGDPTQELQYHGPLPVRIGSYGDPAAVPTRIWAELVRYAKNWTGYSHCWKPKRCSVCS